MKNKMAKDFPKAIFANNCGIQIKVSPVAAGPDVFITSKISPFAIPISLPKMENTVLKTMMAASKDTRLLPIAVVNAFLIKP